MVEVQKLRTLYDFCWPRATGDSRGRGSKTWRCLAVAWLSWVGLQGRAGLAGPGAWLLGRALLQGRAGRITTLGSKSHATSPSYLGQFVIDSQRHEPDAHRCLGASSGRVRASPGRASGLGRESAA